MYSQSAVDEFNELVGILKEMPIPSARKDLLKQTNIRWLRRNIKPDWTSAERALSLLKLCDNTESVAGGGASPVWQETLRKSYADQDAFKKKYLDEKGLEVHCNCWPGNPPKVYSVKLNFTPEEWIDMMAIDGEFLPSCCAIISDVRDVLISTLREGGVIKATDLFRITDALKNHHECGEDDEPQDRIIQTWEAIKDDADMHLTGYAVDPNDLEDACSVLWRSSSRVALDFFFDKDKPEEKFQHDFSCKWNFARVLPAIRTIHDALIERAMEPMEGYAVAEKDEVVMMSGGFAVFATKERADEWTDKFNEYAKKDQERNKKSKIDQKYREKAYGKQEPHRDIPKYSYMTRKIRITIEGGLEFLS